MGAPLGRSAVIRQFEGATRLMRQAGPSVLLYHWIGSVPFASTLLFAWNTVTSPRVTDVAWAGRSLVLALALLWMNCWRSIYAGRLRNHLSGVSTRPWTAARLFHLAAIQSLFGSSKLIVLPFSALILFPWAATVAFYRHLAVIAGREDASPREIMVKARRLASFQAKQNWVALALLAFFQCVLAVNLVVVLGILPQAVRILTGYESLYSRSGIYFLLNPTFGLMVLAVCWLLFDPFAQAVYCLRSFEGESAETGEDLRCGIRRIRATAQVAGGLVLLAAVAPLLHADVAPADLDQAIHQAMQAPEYDWRLPTASVAAHKPWFSATVDQVLAGLRRAAEAIGDVLSSVVRWIFDKLFPSGGPAGKPGAPPGRSIDWTVAALIALVVAAGALFAWQRSRIRRQGPATPPAAVEPVRLDSPDLAADQFPEDRWLELAEGCLAEQNYRFALRAFYLGCLAWLGRRQFVAIQPGKTNYQYERELSRRASDAGIRGLFAANVACFESAWYGEHPVSAEDASRFRQNVQELQAGLTRLHGAVS